MAITDKTGVIKNKYAYSDFGELATNSTETISNPFKYVGKYGVMTDANDLLFMKARYYIPTIGRFINKDPIGFEGDLNLYNYVDSVGEVTNLYTYSGNNPINRIDPLGLWYIDINFSGGNWGGGTGGVTIGSEGIGLYGGGGLVSPGIGISLTWSYSNQSSGWSVGVQGTAIVSYQEGQSLGKGGGRFWEIGIGWPPGGSATIYYQKLWKWSMKKSKCSQE